MGALVAFMAYHMRLLAPFQALMGLYASLATAKVSLARVHQISDVQPEVAEREGATPLDAVDGAIEFDNVTFSFD
ncbi:MAG: ABC transporter ATP-binding protein, partial [Gammaproteobacteria bacterium]|nr:ABC transporter ATP-binding protein [Gammaproteobacteria bacterium]NIV50902.1 ABC transporter ATP-binding protein [Gammaproteobacteria bacterium]NIX84772.1 ABC transporter ATP-binding protein [Gammaproteobacteria bacterium]